MKIVNLSCPVDPKTGLPSPSICHTVQKSGDANIISIKHHETNHFVFYAADYDVKGNHDNNIHELSKAIDRGDLETATNMINDLVSRNKTQPLATPLSSLNMGASIPAGVTTLS